MKTLVISIFITLGIFFSVSAKDAALPMLKASTTEAAFIINNAPDCSYDNSNIEFNEDSPVYDTDSAITDESKEKETNNCAIILTILVVLLIIGITLIIRKERYKKR